MNTDNYLWILPFIVSVIYNVILLVVLVIRYFKIEYIPAKSYTMPLNAIMTAIVAFTLYVTTKDFSLLSIAETPREEALLTNITSLLKSYCVLIIVLPLTQFIIYNLTLEFKCSKQR